jgi:hypothetical protein
VRSDAIHFLNSRLKGIADYANRYQLGVEDCEFDRLKWPTLIA